MASYYKHSGKFAPQGPIFGLLGGMAVSIPLGVLYDYAIITVTEIKLRFLCTVILGLLVGAACGGLMCLGKVRSKALAGIVGLAASAIGLYVSWVVWIRVLCINRKVGCAAAIFRPLEAWKAVLAVNLQGTWGLKGDAPMHGIALWVIWIGEALTILGFGALAAMGLVNRRPFCERCGQWCKKQCKVYLAPSLPPDQLKTQLESGDVNKLEKLPAGNRKQPHYRIDLHACTVCHQLNTLTLEQIFPRNVKTLMSKLLLTPEQASVLRNIEMNHQAAMGVNAVPASAK